MSKAFQQGQADGMCGLYAIMNFLVRTKGPTWRKEENPLSYMLEACRHFGWLTPYYLTLGFEDFQLKAIIDKQFSDYRMPFKAFYLDDVVKSIKIDKFFDLANKIVENGGSLICDVQNGKHWVLVTGDKQSLAVIDSANATNPVTPLGRQTGYKLKNGIVIMPCVIEPIEIDQLCVR